MDYLGFPALNQKALDFLKDRSEPETALELLRQALPRPNRSTPMSLGSGSKVNVILENRKLKTSLDRGEQIRLLNYKITLHYNLACCYEKMELYLDAIENLESAAASLQEAIENHECTQK